MILPFHTNVVCGVKIEKKQLNGEGQCIMQKGEHPTSSQSHLIEVQRNRRVSEDGKGDHGVLEIVEMVGGDSPVRGIEWLVLGGADKELH